MTVQPRVLPQDASCMWMPYRSLLLQLNAH